MGTIISLQQDVDMEYFSLDLAPVMARCAERGVGHVRFPIRDFDPTDLRRKLPDAVKVGSNIPIFPVVPLSFSHLRLCTTDLQAA